MENTYFKNLNKDKRKLEQILEKAVDIYSESSSELILILSDEKIIRIKGLTSQLKDECYEFFGLKFLNSREKNYRKKQREWTKDELNFISKNSDKMNIKELGIALDRTAYQIENQKILLGIKKRKEWTEDEIKYLTENINKTSVILAETLNRSIASVKSKKRHLKLQST